MPEATVNKIKKQSPNISFKSHLKFWFLLAIGFLFGFGFLIALVYLIYLWIKKGASKLSS